jgi:hypothetical protein
MTETPKANPYLTFLILVAFICGLVGVICLVSGSSASQPDEITGVSGNGMGGFIAAGIFLNLAGTAVFAATIIAGSTWKSKRSLVADEVSADDIEESPNAAAVE